MSVNMLVNRNAYDVKQAIYLRETKVKRGLSLEEDELGILQRGFLTKETIQRIEDKQAELAVNFKNLGYYNFAVTNKTWGDDDVFYYSDLNRIVENNKALKKAFFVFSTTPLFEQPKVHYEELNKIEITLRDLSRMVSAVINHTKQCGDIECGE